MKKTLSITLVVAVVLGAFAIAPAQAAKKKKKPKPVATTFFLHGSQQFGETEIPTTWLDSAWMTMDETKPSGGQPKSMFVTNYVGGPNTNCSGNGLLPLWKGELTGTVTGTVKLNVHTIATPAATVVANLYPDANGGCNESALAPAATAEVAVAPGHAETVIEFENVNFKAMANLVVQFHMAGPSPAQVRILYDAAGYESNMEMAVAR